MSSACLFGHVLSSSVTGAPATRSPLTIVVPPTPRPLGEDRLHRDVLRDQT